jgi:hypothetical protein
VATSEKITEFAGIGALTGTPEQVRLSLGGLDVEQVVALTIPHADSETAKALATMVARLAPLVGSIMRRRQDETFNSIVEALVPDVPPPHERVVEARMAADARNAVLDDGDWLTAAEVATIAGFSASNPSAQPNKWKREGLIWALRHRGVDYYPGYGLDPKAGHRPIKALAQVLAVFAGRKDDWGLAYWFASVNSFLGGRRPQDLLASEPSKVVAAAQDEATGVLHG